MVVEIDNPNHEILRLFGSMTEAQLRSLHEAEHGFFIAESPKVIRVAIDHGFMPFAMLCEPRHIVGDAADIIARCPDMTIYTGSRDLLASITGYTLTRGVLCAIPRPTLPSVADICRNARVVAVLQSITDTTNIGAIFRSASAMGVDAVILSADACDPLNRRAVRVSMGTVFTIPWTLSPDPMADLHNLGFTTAALALRHDVMTLDDPRLQEIDKIALFFGTEGDGLPLNIIQTADLVVKIPMHHVVDSLNVAAAAAVTFWQLRKI